MNYLLKHIYEKTEPLLGAEFVGLCDDPEGFVGLVMEKDGKQTILWVQSDAEGNNPGWLQIVDGDAEEAR